MKIDVLTLFPKMFSGPFSESILKRAQEKGLVRIRTHDLRKWAEDKHKTVDDRPFGGGTGMLIKVSIVDKAVKEIKKLRNKEQKNSISKTKVILLDAGGKKFTQKDAVRLSKLEHIIFIAGHYEGVDYRVHKHIADKIYSIGDYVLTGGEIPVMVLIDSTVRLIPGVLVKSDAAKFESFSSHLSHPSSPGPLLEHPQYTRPANYLGWKVPGVLISGNHKEIEKWERNTSLEKTKQVRPDLLK